MKINTHFDHISLSSSCNEKFFGCRENQNTFYVQYFFFRKSCPFLDNVVKYFRAGQATDDRVVHADCMLDTKVYKHTHTHTHTHRHTHGMLFHCNNDGKNAPHKYTACLV
jgi:hypothetical protein